MTTTPGWKLFADPTPTWQPFVEALREAADSVEHAAVVHGDETAVAAMGAVLTGIVTHLRQSGLADLFDARPTNDRRTTK